MVDRPRCLDWTPLATQQLRLRNLIQIIGHNIECDPSASVLYYTLHSSPSAASFYRSPDESVCRAPKVVSWPEITCEKMAKSAVQCVCIKVWQRLEELEQLLFTWGVYFSGLVPVVKRNEARYRSNTLVFQMHGGQFASADSFDASYATKVAFPMGLPGAHSKYLSLSSSCDQQHQETVKLRNSLRQLTPNRNLLAIKSSPDLSSFLWNGSMLKSPSSIPSQLQSLDPVLELRSTDSRLLKFRYLTMEFKESDCRPSYSVKRLTSLHTRQRRIKYQVDENEELRERIYTKSAYCLNLEMATNRVFRPAPTKIPGMGKQLSRLLYEQVEPLKPEDILKGQELRRKIEIANFRVKMLRTERGRMKEDISRLQVRLSKLNNRNVELEVATMSGYRSLSREREELPTQEAGLEKTREHLRVICEELSARRLKLLKDLQQIYAIKKLHNGLYTINSVPLPDAESYRSYSVSPADISVALGFCCHVVILCSRILNYPLRNRIQFEGSASKIEDNIKPLPPRDKIYPLFCPKNPPSNALLYGVYLLSQNISQIKFYLGYPATSGKATLSNLLDILDGVSRPIRRDVLGGSSIELSSRSTAPLLTSPIDISDGKSRTRICQSFDGNQAFIPISHSSYEPPLYFNDKGFGSEPSLLDEPESSVQNSNSNASSELILEESDENS